MFHRVESRIGASHNSSLSDYEWQQREVLDMTIRNKQVLLPQRQVLRPDERLDEERELGCLGARPVEYSWDM